MRASIHHILGRPWRQRSFGFEPRAPLIAGLPFGAIGSRTEGLDPVLLLSGLAVLSAGLVVLRVAHAPLAATAPASVPAREPKRYTAEEALAERTRRAGDREVLLEALAAAASTFYSIAGHLPGEASERVVRKADDLRELVWLNRA